MKRRQFLKRTLALTAASAVYPHLLLGMQSPPTPPHKKKVLKGFIVSDAHFGWDNDTQPAPKKQAAMMQMILKKFPDLDIFFDTGDAHHNGKDRNDERRQWTEIIPGIASRLPFYYVPGNHEITHNSAGDDEFICNELGSLSCRPYYSFDMYGIHFVSIPELVRAVYVNHETIEWLKADLELNKDKTTILLSHNNIIGTTGPFEEGYRGLVNSEELTEIMNKYPNVISWMHGHNHNYEIVKKFNKLFVSNGRIGGFDPSHGKYGLGGVYFEITKDQLKVKCYSAEFDQYLEKKDESLTQSIKTDTTLDFAKLPSYTFGYGGARDGQKIPAYIHYASQNKNAELFFAGTPTEIINDDPSFELFMARESRRGQHWQLMGSSFHAPGKNQGYKWMDPGIKIFKSNPKIERVRMKIPGRKQDQYTYYRTAPGHKYQAYMELDANNGRQNVELQFLLHDRNGKEIKRSEKQNWRLAPGLNYKKTSWTIPQIKDVKTIYSDKESDNVLHLSVEVNFTDLDSPILLKTFELTADKAYKNTEDPALTVDGKKYSHNGSLKGIESAKVEIPNLRKERYAITANAQGSKKVTWLIRQSGIDWQVRNAPVADKDNHLEIGPLRNTFSGQNEIVISPSVHVLEPYFNRLKDIQKAKVYPINRGNKNLKIEIAKAGGNPHIEVISYKKPKNVKGAEDWKYKDNILMIKPGKNKISEIAF